MPVYAEKLNTDSVYILSAKYGSLNLEQEITVLSKHDCQFPILESAVLNTSPNNVGRFSILQCSALPYKGHGISGNEKPLSLFKLFRADLTPCVTFFQNLQGSGPARFFF